MDSSIPFVDELGRSTSLERSGLNAREFIEVALSLIEADLNEVAGRTKRREVVRVREMLMTIGIDWYRFRVKDLAQEFGVKYDTASLWGRRGVKRRMEDPAFASKTAKVVAAIESVQSEPTNSDRECANI